MSVFESNPDAHLTNCSGLQGGLATETASEERAANAIEASTAPTKDVGGVRALISYFGIERRFIEVGRRLSKRIDRAAQSRLFLAIARAEANKQKPFNKFGPHIWNLP